jgi:hypothetical protein
LQDEFNFLDRQSFLIFASNQPAQGPTAVPSN